MKTATLSQKLFSLRLLLIVGIALTFGACKNNDPQPDEPFSEAIRSNIPQETIDKIREMGIKVNEGTKPPLLNGTYWLSPLIMTMTEVPNDNYKVGHRFDDYKIKLYNQDEKKLTISLDNKGYNFSGELRTTSIGQNGAYIAGKGNFFTVFIVTEGEHTYNSSRFKMLEVYSGELSPTGIKNIQNAIIMIDNYGNVNDDLIPNNTGRAFYDSDAFSESGGTFRIASNRKGNVAEKATDGERELFLKK
ncbi:hypothetical protein MUK70_15180 [Dyadobacter chenwenxiniae]|uniref:Lipoprotein n=1 Tax=Dyadobacter chenwenxiniae TaxID=2906456 RepID=A0A9X1PG90_9BACT|nr:hypothetical protein [Dyadobacter chenwenxiniae]MCF0060585.1 hypothetical protein [Dyadobacter chenwenxiniae]UON86316.1 hypothetical protein MUK70_15180 [Dyadobacter chenwenxiniae]